MFTSVDCQNGPSCSAQLTSAAVSSCRSASISSHSAAATTAKAVPVANAPYQWPWPESQATIGMLITPPRLPPVLSTPLAAIVSARATDIVAAQYGPSVLSTPAKASVSAPTAT